MSEARAALDAMASHWPAIDRLLDQALELAPAERARWLDARPGLEQPVRDALRRLLASGAAVETGDFLQRLPSLPLPPEAHPGAQPDAALPAAGERVGPWRLRRLVGEGGMGQVFLAERADGQMKREVALKLPRLGWLPGLAERLARERDILAALEHPHIARLYDAGVDAAGRPWLALEFVDGQPLTAWCAARDSDLGERLRLLLQVADAVSAAHARLVVHRDLKPANILVTAEGRAMLLDFGIAGLVQPDGEAGATVLGPRALTRDYASPEQLRGEPLGTASDVYSLGVVAFELLAGARPPPVSALAEASSPPLASRHATQPARARELRGDLDAILAMALEPQPQRRYASVEALAQDLQRFMAHEPVRARRQGWAYRTAKLLRRHRLAVAAGVVSAAVLAGSSVVALRQAQQADAARAVAEQARASSEAARAETDRARADAERQADAARQAQAAAERAAARAAAAAAAEQSANRTAQARSAEAAAAARRAEAVRDFLTDVFRSAGSSQADAASGRALTAPQLVLRGAERIEAAPGLALDERLVLLDVFASVLHEMGEGRQAVELRRRQVDLAHRALGPEHPDTLSSRVDLALALIGRGENVASRAELEVAREALERVAPRSGAMARALVLTANAEANTRPALAERSARRAIALFDELARPQPGRRPDPWLPDNRANAWLQWGRALIAAGRPAEALPALDSAWQDLQALYGPEMLNAEEVLGWRVEALWALGRRDDALAAGAERIARIERNAVPRPDRLALAWMTQARLLLEAGRRAEAEAALARVAAVQRQPGGDRGAVRPAAVQGLAIVIRLAAGGDAPDAASIAELQRLVQSPGLPGSLEAELRHGLALALVARGDRAAAEAERVAVQRIAERLPGLWRVGRQRQAIDDALRAAAQSPRAGREGAVGAASGP